jgi:transcriptional regulator with XRE-family HTH domain
MNINEILFSALLSMRDAGMSNREMARIAGVSNPHINRLLNGTPELIGKVKLETLVRLFPREFARLTDAGALAVASGSGSAASVHGNATAAPVTLATEAPVADAILEKLLSAPGFCDSCRIAALRIATAARKLSPNRVPDEAPGAAAREGIVDYAALQDLLRKKRARGATNQEMAGAADISQPHINRLLNGPAENLGKVKLETLVRLFPQEFARVAETRVVAIASGSGSAASVHGNATAAPVALTTEAPLADAIMEKLLSAPGLCDPCRLAAVRIVASVKNQPQK